RWWRSRGPKRSRSRPNGTPFKRSNRALRAGSGVGGLSRGTLQPVAIVLPPGSVAGSHVVVVPAQADRAVDQFPHDIRMPGVAIGLGDHVDEDAVQGDFAPLLGPPRGLRERIEWQRLERRVGVLRGPAVEL